MQRSMLRNAMLLLATCLLAASCSSESPFDPSTVSLVGTWRVAADMDLRTPNAANAVGHCQIRDLDVTITDGPGTLPGTVAGSTGDGGTIQCTTNGTTSAVAPYLANRGLAITRSDGSVTIANGTNISIFVGALVAADRMEGATGLYESAYVGTWTGVRQ